MGDWELRFGEEEKGRRYYVGNQRENSHFVSQHSHHEPVVHNMLYSFASVAVSSCHILSSSSSHLLAQVTEKEKDGLESKKSEAEDFLEKQAQMLRHKAAAAQINIYQIQARKFVQKEWRRRKEKEGIKPISFISISTRRR
jgi:hypothetical protein